MSKENENINEVEKNESNLENSTNEVKELLSQTEDADNTEITKESNHKPTCIKKILSNIIDQVVVLAISGLVLAIFSFILKFIGYKIIMPLGFMLIFYFIVNVIYTPIVEKSKSNKSIGKRIINID